MPNFAYGQNYDLLPLVQAEWLSRGLKGRRLLELFPLAFYDTSLVEWEQLDAAFGIMSLRGLGGLPPAVPFPGFRKFAMEPGYYGEHSRLDYEQLTKMREPGTRGDVADFDTLSNTAIQQLTERALNRMEDVVAKLLTTGQFYVANQGGGLTHADTIANYRVTIPTTPWSTSGSAAPITDIMNAKANLQQGTTTSFGPKSTFLCNSYTFNDIVQSAQFQNGYKLQFGQTPLSDADVNKLMQAIQGPQIEVYDGGYFANPGTATGRPSGWTFFLPRGFGVWVGSRPDGQQVGEFILTRNPDAFTPDTEAPDFATRNPDLDAPAWIDGLYTRYYEHTMEPPTYRRWDVGFNGGPALLYRTGTSGFFYSASQPVTA